MARLFGRNVRFEIGSGVSATRIEAPGLRISFDVSQDEKLEPNTATVRIFNLSLKSIQKFEAENTVCKLFAGYDGKPELIAQGSVFQVQTFISGPDVITEIEFGDGAKALSEATISKQYPPGTPNTLIATDVAQSLRSVTAGGIESFKNIAIGSLKSFVSGFTASGNAADVLGEIYDTTQTDINVQNGELLIVDRNTPVPSTILSFNSNSGLVGSPRKQKKRNEKTNKDESSVTFQTLLVPTVRVNTFVALDSRVFKGSVKVVSVRHVGDSNEGTFLTEIEGRIL